MSPTVVWKEIPLKDHTGKETGKTELKPFVDDKLVSWMPLMGGQSLFLACSTFELLAFGNRGGGKSACLLVDFMSNVRKGFGADYKGIIFRQTYPMLSDIVGLSKKLIPTIFPGATFNEARYEWRFPLGESLLFRHIARSEDYDNYHGWSVPWLGFEELTTWADDRCYKVMQSICRCPNPAVPLKVRATTNPYGVGHGWVKNRFKLPLASPTDYVGPVIKTVENGNPLPDRRAIRIDLRDNKVLKHSDPFYVEKIRAAARNEAELVAWTEGSWDIVSGGMFDDVWKREINVIPDIQINHLPSGWTINRAYDHGQSRPFSVGWWAQSNGEPIRFSNGVVVGQVPGDLIRIFEWYGCQPNSPNEGLRYSAHEIAYGILEREQTWGLRNHVFSGVADSAIFDPYEGSKSVAGDMRTKGIIWYPIDKGPGSRLQGWQRMRDYMKFASPVKGGTRELPGLWVCRRCVEFLRTVPVLPRDPDKMDDVDTTAEDHIGDETRYRLRMKDLSVKSDSWK